ncbi:MAG: hypothetical protein WBM77_01475 [Maribacter sp.]|jgi:hypothetical protein
MQDDKKTKFDQFIQDRIKEEGLEKPSLNFTDTVISKIETLKEHSEVTVYKPLIPKNIWYSGAAILIMIFSYLVYGNIDMEFIWLPEMKMQQIGQLNLTERLPDFNISSIYVYAFIGLAFFVGVQVYLLKTHFDKRYYLD